MKTFFERLPGTGYICAHRGARSIAPENTFLALEKALACGADLWETDIQMTADGELVLFHDRQLARTTDVASHKAFAARRPWLLNEFRLEELAALDAGSWFIATDPFGTVAAGEVTADDLSKIRKQRIPVLREILSYCRKNDFPFNLEIKDQSGTAADTIIASRVLDLVIESGCEDLVLISSFNHSYLRQIRVRNPEIALAALTEGAHPPDLLDYLQGLEVDAYHPDRKITDAYLVEKLVAAGIRVNLWTVNDLGQAQYYSRAGATFICTDWPQRMVGARHSS